jgi:hypothetical protein
MKRKKKADKVTYGEYKGHPTMSIPVNGRGLTFGLAKARAIVVNMIEIEEFIAKHEKPVNLDELDEIEAADAYEAMRADEQAAAIEEIKADGLDRELYEHFKMADETIDPADYREGGIEDIARELGMSENKLKCMRMLKGKEKAAAKRKTAASCLSKEAA